MSPKENEMKIKDLLLSVASLVEERDTIDHGSIRCLHSDRAVREIEQAEGCDEVDTGTIGDDVLAEKIRDMVNDADALGKIDFDDLRKLEDAYKGDDIIDYLDSGKEDELRALNVLIDAVADMVG